MTSLKKEKTIKVTKEGLLKDAEKLISDAESIGIIVPPLVKMKFNQIKKDHMLKGE